MRVRLFLFTVALFAILPVRETVAQDGIGTDIRGEQFGGAVVEGSRQAPVVVLFRKGDCPACYPLIATIPPAAFVAFAGKVKFVTIDVGKEPALASELKITNVPAVLVYKNGEVVGRANEPGNSAVIRKFFSDLAPPEAKQAVVAPDQRQMPPPRPRPAGADLKRIGAWTISRTRDGVAISLYPSRFDVGFNETSRDTWQAKGNAGFSIGYDPEKLLIICHVTFSYVGTTITRNQRNERVYEDDRLAQVVVKFDDQVVAVLPALISLDAEAERKARESEPEALEAWRRSQIRRGPFDQRPPKSYSVRLNDHFEWTLALGQGSGGQQKFRALLERTKRISIAIGSARDSMVIAEFPTDDTGAALDYLIAERQWAKDMRERGQK